MAGNPGDGLCFVSQLLRGTNPLADVVFRFQAQQATDTERDQQRQQYRCTQVFEQVFATRQQKRGNP
ncbi:hypothetical protein D3C72_2393650 [compost metagenome]